MRHGEVNKLPLLNIRGLYLMRSAVTRAVAVIRAL
jgi:hypothetical protein